MAIETCNWTTDEMDGDCCWETSCGHLHEFIVDGPDENQFRFCPFCGKTLIHNPLEQADA